MAWSEATWDDVYKAEVGFTFVDRVDEGVKFIIKRGAFSLCAYVGIPENHPLANHNYNEIALECHGGLTYSGKGSGVNLPIGFFWYGWDYAHFRDCRIYDHGVLCPGVRWTPKMVEQDAEETIDQFKQLVSIAESAVHKVALNTKKRHNEKIKVDDILNNEREIEL